MSDMSPPLRNDAILRQLGCTGDPVLANVRLPSRTTLLARRMFDRLRCIIAIVLMALKQAVNPVTTQKIRSTTVVCVRRDTSVVMAADGQVTLGEGIIKHTAKKIRRLYNDKILAGF